MAEKLKITVLGCGSSTGTPAAGNIWGRCDPSEPKNRRLRASILIQSEATDIIVDASYDLRHQMNAYNIGKLDAVLISHAHSDHVNGIDDLKVMTYTQGAPLPCYSNQETLDEIYRRWPYVIDGGSDGVYKSFLTRHMITPYIPFTVGDIEILPVLQDHGTMDSLGFRIGDFAYCIDVMRLDDKALDALQGVKTWIVDGGGHHADYIKTHARFDTVFKWVERLKPDMTFISDLTIGMDYNAIAQELPPHIRPLYDGMIINI